MDFELLHVPSGFLLLFLIASATVKQYFNTEPLACDPSSLSKYAPSKEMDIKKLGEATKQASQIRRGDEPQADSSSRETSYTNSYEEEETTSLQDHSPIQMQRATDMATDDETGAEEDSYRDPYGHNQNMEEDIPLPMSPSRVNSKATILSSVYENGTSSSERVGIMHTLIEDCTVN